MNRKILDIFQHSKNNDNHVIIEGVQALKHAIRFKAEVEHIITCDINELKSLISELAPDISNMVSSASIEVSDEEFKKFSPKNHRTKVVSLAKKRMYEFSDIADNKPIVFLENPKDLENIGAVIRVAAAADIGAVIIDADVSIWHSAIIRGAAGLHYALPVFNLRLSKIDNQRPKIALDPLGKSLSGFEIPTNSVLIFGTERHGIKAETLQTCNQVVSLSMKPGVSSLNLATSVAATLYQM